MQRNLVQFGIGLGRRRMVVRVIALLFAILGSVMWPVASALAGKGGGDERSASLLHAPDFPVSGRVTSDKGEGLPGESVIEKGTSNGTVTDSNGGYTFTVSSGDVTLVFSFIGYTTQEVPVNGRASVEVAMTEDVVAL